jgi:HD-like signal output (HDOD) protein
MIQNARDYLIESLTRAQTIAPMPHICAKLAELTSQPEIDQGRLVHLIQSDPGVAGEIMRMANSAALRPRSPIVSLQQAVTWLGVAEVRNLTLAAALRGEVFTAPGHEAEAHALWREAWLGGLWAKEIARLRRKHVESAFLAGLMHRAGAALTVKLLADFEREQRTAFAAPEFSALQLEFEAACGRLLMTNWCLPADVQAAACEWRNYQTSAQVELAGTVHAAHLFAELGADSSPARTAALLEDPVFMQLGVFPDERLAILAQRDRVAQIAGI